MHEFQQTSSPCPVRNVRAIHAHRAPAGRCVARLPTMLLHVCFGLLISILMPAVGSAAEIAPAPGFSAPALDFAGPASPLAADFAGGETYVRNWLVDARGPGVVTQPGPVRLDTTLVDPGTLSSVVLATQQTFSPQSFAITATVRFAEEITGDQIYALTMAGSEMETDDVSALIVANAA